MIHTGPGLKMKHRTPLTLTLLLVGELVSIVTPGSPAAGECPSFICLSVHLLVRLCVCPPIGLSACPSVRLSICRSVYLSVCPSVCQSVYLSVCLSVCPRGET